MNLLRRLALRRCKWTSLQEMIAPQQLVAAKNLVSAFVGTDFMVMLTTASYALRTFCDLYYALHYVEMLRNFQQQGKLHSLQCMHLAFRELSIFQEKCLSDGALQGVLYEALQNDAVTVASADCFVYYLRIVGNFCSDDLVFATEVFATLNFEKYLQIKQLLQPAAFCFYASFSNAQLALLSETQLADAMRRVNSFICAAVAQFTPDNERYLANRLFQALIICIPRVEDALPSFQFSEPLLRAIVVVFSTGNQSNLEQHLDLLCYCLLNLQQYEHCLLQSILSPVTQRYLGRWFINYVAQLPGDFAQHACSALDCVYFVEASKHLCVTQAAVHLITLLSDYDTICYYIQRFVLELQDFAGNQEFVDKYELFDQI